MCWSGGMTSDQPTVIVYTRDQLIDLKPTRLANRDTHLKNLHKYGLFRRVNARRLHRGGLACHRPVSVCITEPSSHHNGTLDNNRIVCRTYIKPDAFHQSQTGAKPLWCAYINARSCRNKTISIHDFILSNNIDLLAITETWLGTDIDDTIMWATPYRISLSALSTHIWTEGRQCRTSIPSWLSVKIDQDVTNDSYTQFDFLNCSIRERGVSRYFYLCAVYRPPPSTKKGNNKADRTKTFHSEWDSYLEHMGTTPSELLVVGDINIHLDVSSDASTVKFVLSSWSP